MNLKDLVTVLGHELRTPLAAIMGYQELLVDGIYGELDAATNEPLERIQSSALQLLNLIDGLQELAAPSAADDELVQATSSDLLKRLIDAARPFTDSRGVKLDVSQCVRQDLGRLPVQRLLRAAELATVAAVKSSSGRTLLILCVLESNHLQVRVENSALHPVNDSPAGVLDGALGGRPLTAARLRLAMSEAALTAVGGSLELREQSNGTAVILNLPLTR